MSVVKFPKAKRTTAAPGDLAVGAVTADAWMVVVVESVDAEGIVATVRDAKGVAAVYRVFDIAQGLFIAAAATLTDEGRALLPNLVGDFGGLKREFRKHATEAAGPLGDP